MDNDGEESPTRHMLGSWRLLKRQSSSSSSSPVQERRFLIFRVWEVEFRVLYKKGNMLKYYPGDRIILRRGLSEKKHWVLLRWNGENKRKHKKQNHHRRQEELTPRRACLVTHVLKTLYRENTLFGLWLFSSFSHRHCKDVSRTPTHGE